MTENANNNFGELIERLLQRGERVVILGRGEPMVILPLAEYDKLTGHQLESAEATAATPYLEPVDNLGSAVEDDDQYYPEPI